MHHGHGNRSPERGGPRRARDSSNGPAVDNDGRTDDRHECAFRQQAHQASRDAAFREVAYADDDLLADIAALGVADGVIEVRLEWIVSSVMSTRNRGMPDSIRSVSAVSSSSGVAPL